MRSFCDSYHELLDCIESKTKDAALATVGLRRGDAVRTFVARTLTLEAAYGGGPVNTKEIPMATTTFQGTSSSYDRVAPLNGKRQ